MCICHYPVSRAKEAGVTVLSEIGVEPGIDHLYAMKTIDEAHAKGSKVVKFTSVCGGLPAPEADDNPLHYKLSWSARGFLLASGFSATWLEDGNVRRVAGDMHILPGISLMLIGIVMVQKRM